MESFDLIFTGKVLPGVDAHEAAAEFAGLVVLPAVTSGQRRLAVQGLSAAHARAWLARVSAIGIEATLQASSVPSDNTWPPPEQSAPQQQAVAPAPEASATYANSIGMEFILIPAGKFWMGSGEDDEDADDDEKPRREVTISRPFYLGKYPVTQAQWEAVMGNNPSYFEGSDCPVESVSWDDVQVFIKRLNAKEGHERYRLPTEAEWEYACRAGSTSRYCFGDDEGELGDFAWYGDNSGDETHPVGQKHANAWGLHDMHGNVWEWVQDWYGYRAYADTAGSATDPTGPSAGVFRALRGGGWDFGARSCWSACRSKCSPDAPYVSVGFRLALSPGH